jgi:hypothetical protein
VRRIERRLGTYLSTLLPALSLALAAASAGAAAPDQANWPRVVMRDPYAQGALLWALHSAAEQLAQPACEAVLSDFTAEDGRPLQEKLEAMGLTPAGYLPFILFRDGSNLSTCTRSDSVIAFTAPGHRVVYLCTRRFQDLWRRDPRTARAVVIHEALHTLGLGENPPSSLQITRTVRHRCAG